MDNKERFDQLESLLADLARKQDQQSDQISQIITELRRQGEAIGRQGEAIGRQGEAINKLIDAVNLLGEASTRQEKRLDNIGDQMEDVINILKISEARHTKAEKQQGEMLVEIREQGRRLDAQAQRQDAAIDAIKALLSRAEAVDKRVGGVIESQRQIIQLAQLNTESIEDQEPRIQRLEDEVFRQAS